MKKFFNFLTIVATVFFILGAVAAVTADPANWIAFIWVLIGFLWMVMSRGLELQKEQLRKDYEERITELKTSRDEYMKSSKDYHTKYNAKLNENYGLAARNKALTEDNLRLIKENLDLSGKGETLGAAPVVQPAAKESMPHGNIKLKTKGKKKAASKEKTEIKEKA